VICEKQIMYYVSKTDYQSGFSQKKLACGAFCLISFACGAFCFIKTSGILKTSAAHFLPVKSSA